MNILASIFRPSVHRAKVEQLEAAVRARELAILQAEQARWNLAENELNAKHQQDKIDRLTLEIAEAARANLIPKSDLKLVHSLRPDNSAFSPLAASK